MSHSLSPPWIYPSIVSIFTDQPDEDLDVYQSSQRFSCPPKTVHVIGYNTKLRALRVSDTKHSMYVFLTLYGFNEITKEISFPEINHCIIKLRHYHVSTVVQASGIRDPEDLRAITFPLVINCSSVQYLGGNGGLDLQRQDEIHDINTVIKQQLLNNISYVKLYEKLLKSQFPDEKYLPDAEGIFCDLPVFDESNPLDENDCIISTQEKELLAQMTSYCRRDNLLIQQKQQQIVEVTPAGTPAGEGKRKNIDKTNAASPSFAAVTTGKGKNGKGKNKKKGTKHSLPEVVITEDDNLEIPKPMLPLAEDFGCTLQEDEYSLIGQTLTETQHSEINNAFLAEHFQVMERIAAVQESKLVSDENKNEDIHTRKDEEKELDTDEDDGQSVELINNNNYGKVHDERFAYTYESFYEQTYSSQLYQDIKPLPKVVTNKTEENAAFTMYKDFDSNETTVKNTLSSEELLGETYDGNANYEMVFLSGTPVATPVPTILPSAFAKQGNPHLTTTTAGGAVIKPSVTSSSSSSEMPPPLTILPINEMEIEHTQVATEEEQISLTQVPTPTGGNSPKVSVSTTAVVEEPEKLADDVDALFAQIPTQDKPKRETNRQKGSTDGHTSDSNASVESSVSRRITRSTAARAGAEASVNNTPTTKTRAAVAVVVAAAKEVTTSNISLVPIQEEELFGHTQTEEDEVGMTQVPTPFQSPRQQHRPMTPPSRMSVLLPPTATPPTVSKAITAASMPPTNPHPDASKHTQSVSRSRTRMTPVGSPQPQGSRKSQPTLYPTQRSIDYSKLHGDDFLYFAVRKHFPEFGWYNGSITGYNPPYYLVTYEDNDQEELLHDEIIQIVQGSGPIVRVSNSSSSSSSGLHLRGPGISAIDSAHQLNPIQSDSRRSETASGHSKVVKSSVGTLTSEQLQKEIQELESYKNYVSELVDTIDIQSSQSDGSVDTTSIGKAIMEDILITQPQVKLSKVKKGVSVLPPSIEQAYDKKSVETTSSDHDGDSDTMDTDSNYNENDEVATVTQSPQRKRIHTDSDESSPREEGIHDAVGLSVQHGTNTLTSTLSNEDRDELTYNFCIASNVNPYTLLRQQHDQTMTLQLLHTQYPKLLQLVKVFQQQYRLEQEQQQLNTNRHESGELERTPTNKKRPSSSTTNHSSSSSSSAMKLRRDSFGRLVSAIDTKYTSKQQKNQASPPADNPRHQVVNEKTNTKLKRGKLEGGGAIVNDGKDKEIVTTKSSLSDYYTKHYFSKLPVTVREHKLNDLIKEEKEIERFVIPSPLDANERIFDYIKYAQANPPENGKSIPPMLRLYLIAMQRIEKHNNSLHGMELPALTNEEEMRVYLTYEGLFDEDVYRLLNNIPAQKTSKENNNNTKTRGKGKETLITIPEPYRFVKARQTYYQIFKHYYYSLPASVGTGGAANKRKNTDKDIQKTGVKEVSKASSLKATSTTKQQEEAEVEAESETDGSEEAYWNQDDDEEEEEVVILTQPQYGATVKKFHTLLPPVPIRGPVTNRSALPPQNISSMMIQKEVKEVSNQQSGDVQEDEEEDQGESETEEFNLVVTQPSQSSELLLPTSGTSTTVEKVLLPTQPSTDVHPKQTLQQMISAYTPSTVDQIKYSNYLTSLPSTRHRSVLQELLYEDEDIDNFLITAKEGMFTTTKMDYAAYAQLHPPFQGEAYPPLTRAFVIAMKRLEKIEKDSSICGSSHHIPLEDWEEMGQSQESMLSAVSQSTAGTTIIRDSTTIPKEILRIREYHIRQQFDLWMDEKLHQQSTTLKTIEMYFPGKGKRKSLDGNGSMTSKGNTSMHPIVAYYKKLLQSHYQPLPITTMTITNTPKKDTKDKKKKKKAFKRKVLQVFAEEEEEDDSDEEVKVLSAVIPHPVSSPKPQETNNKKQKTTDERISLSAVVQKQRSGSSGSSSSSGNKPAAVMAVAATVESPPQTSTLAVSSPLLPRTNNRNTKFGLRGVSSFVHPPIKPSSNLFSNGGGIKSFSKPSSNPHLRK